MGLRSIFAAVGLAVAGLAFGQVDPVSVFDFKVGDYSKAVPRPFEPLGFRIGDRHITSGEVVRYVQAVDATSDRVQSGIYAESYDGRQMPYAVVSSAKNLARLDEIVKQNRKNVFETGSVSDADLEKMPLIMWIGGGVHGNEASGVESCLMTLYHLAADQRAETREMLDKMVVIIAPMYNPDGRDRFANWVNGQRGKNALADGQDTEHSEPWPGGRTNKYWFDLNRDWFPLTQPESAGRHQLVMKFRPQVILDYHEQGGDNYFFQPGVQSRVNPFTPKANQEFTFKFARYYAKAMEGAGEGYFTEERYDDFYIGKGSTYPDVIGSIGILFEQASSRSLLRPTGDGVLSFAHTVRNQVVTSLASLEAGRDMRVDLLKYQRDFFGKNRMPADAGSYVVQDDNAGRELVNLLLPHEIEVYLGNGEFVIPQGQTLNRLLSAMFEEQLKFEDRLFYDISSWSLKHVTEATVTERTTDAPSLGKRVLEPLLKIGSFRPVKQTLGFIVRNREVGFHSAVNSALVAGYKGFIATRAIGGAKAGDVFFEASAKDEKISEHLSKDFGVWIDGVQGETGEIVSWGGNAVTRIPVPKIALLVGDGVDSNNAGEQWWMLDRKLDIPVALLDVSRIGTLELSKYTTILVTGGRYPAATADVLAAYARSGGTIVATASGATWASNSSIWTVKSNSVRESFSGMNYGELQAARGIDPVPGSVFQVDYDKSHPLSWGQEQDASFREGGSFWDVPDEPGVTVARYSDNPVVSGYVSPGIVDLAKGKAAVLAKRLGSGRVVFIADNPCFRGYMTAQRKIWLNALMFSRAF
ncbi:MAG: M14 family zinc carboxypeptidase [Fimbriimonadaceae bacterium]